MFHIVKSTEKQCSPENLDATPNKSHVSVTSKQQGGENLHFQPGLLSRRQNDTAPAPKLFFHEHGFGSSSGSLGFHENISGSGALFFHNRAPAPVSVRFYALIVSIVLVGLKLTGKWNISSTGKQGPSLKKKFGEGKPYCFRFDDVTMFTQP